MNAKGALAMTMKNHYGDGPFLQITGCETPFNAHKLVVLCWRLSAGKYTAAPLRAAADGV